MTEVCAYCVDAEACLLEGSAAGMEVRHVCPPSDRKSPTSVCCNAFNALQVVGVKFDVVGKGEGRVSVWSVMLMWTRRCVQYNVEIGRASCRERV